MAQTELYIENQRVDLSDDVVMPLTLWLASIKDIGKRTSSYSKTIVIPGTKHNNIVFGHAYNLGLRTSTPATKNIGYEFNRKKLSDFILLSDGTNVLSGTAELRQVKELDGVVHYEIVLYGELINLVNNIADKELRDLDTSELDHEFTIEAIENSWNFNTPYVYPLIDYGVVNTRMESVPMSNFRPAVKASWYWDKIFEDAGFTYEGDFFNTDQWNKLIIPYNKESRPQSLSFEDILLETGAQIGSLESDTILFTTAKSDPEGNWDSSTNTLTTTDTGSYNFSSGLGMVLGGSADLAPSNWSEGDTVQNRPFSLYLDLMVDGVAVETSELEIEQGRIYDVFHDGDQLPERQERVALTFTVYITQYIESGKNVQFRFRHDIPNEPYYNLDTEQNIDGNLNILLRANQLMTISPGTIEGSIVDGSDIVPSSVKQKDFITGILKLFNLYVEGDKNHPKKVNIKTRDEYYNTDVFREWTDKVDHSNEIVNESLEDSNVRTLQFTFKEDDDDYYGSLYKSRWGRIYGETRIDTGYEFNNEVKDVLELPFSPTVPIQYSRGPLIGDTRIEVTTERPNRVRVVGYTEAIQEDPSETEPDLPELERVFIGRRILIGEQQLEITDVISPWEFVVNEDVDEYRPRTVNDISYRVFNSGFQYIGEPTSVVPSIFKSEDGGITTEPFNSELRLLYYNGLIPSNQWVIQQTPVKPETSVRYFYNDSFDKFRIYSQYPFTSHVLGNDPTDFNFDLLFERPNQIYWALDGIEVSLVYPIVSTNTPINVEPDEFTMRLDLSNVSNEGYTAEYAFQWREGFSGTWSNQTAWVSTTENGTKEEVLTGLDFDTEYSYRGIARNTLEPSELSIGATVQITTPDLERPVVSTNTPTNVTSREFTMRLDLSNVEEHGYIAEYGFQWREGFSGDWTDTTWTDTTTNGTKTLTLDANPDTEYSYRGVARRQDDPGVVTTAATVQLSTPELQFPTISTNTPTNITESSFTMRLDISNVEEHSYNAEYRFQWREQGASTWNTTNWLTTNLNGTRTVDLTGLDFDTGYEYRGQGRRQDEPTIIETAATVQTSTNDLERPVASTNPATNVESEQFTMGLDLSNVSGQGYTAEYGFQYREGFSGSWTDTTWTATTSDGTKTQLLDNLNEDTGYSYRGRARRQDDPTNIHTGATVQITTPSIKYPTISTNTPINVSANSFTARVDVGNVSEHGYTAEWRIQYREGFSGTWTDTTPWETTTTNGTKEVNIPTDPNTQYSYRAQGRRQDRPSEVQTAATVQITTPDIEYPTVSTNTPTNRTTDGFTMRLDISNVEEHGYNAEYRFQWRAMGDSTWNTTNWLITNLNGTRSTSISGLSPDTGYEYRGQGRRQDEPSTISTAATVQTSTLSETLESPTGFSANYNEPNCEMDLNWNSVSNADTYVLQRSIGGGSFTTIYTGSSTNYTDNVNGLPGAQDDDLDLEYRVRAEGSGWNPSNWTNTQITLTNYSTGPCSF